MQLWVLVGLQHFTNSLIYLAFIWIAKFFLITMSFQRGQPPTHETTNMLRLYNARCLPRALYYTCICLPLTSAQTAASNDSGLGCRSALSGEAVCRPLGHYGVSCLHGERQVKNKSAPPPKQSLKKRVEMSFSEVGDEEWEGVWSGVAHEGEKTEIQHSCF